MTYTGILGHLEKAYVKDGDTPKRGDKLGKMGRTGKSTAKHVHFGLVPGEYNRIVRMDEMLGIVASLDESGMKDLFFQYHNFIDKEFFGGVPPVITSGFGEPDYTTPWIFHTGYDLVPKDRFKTELHYDVINNRSQKITIIKAGKDAGYGNFILFKIEI